MSPEPTGARRCTDIRAAGSATDRCGHGGSSDHRATDGDPRSTVNGHCHASSSDHRATHGDPHTGLYGHDAAHAAADIAHARPYGGAYACLGDGCAYRCHHAHH